MRSAQQRSGLPVRLFPGVDQKELCEEFPLNRIFPYMVFLWVEFFVPNQGLKGTCLYGFSGYARSLMPKWNHSNKELNTIQTWINFSVRSPGVPTRGPGASNSSIFGKFGGSWDSKWLHFGSILGVWGRPQVRWAASWGRGWLGLISVPPF